MSPFRRQGQGGIFPKSMFARHSKIGSNGENP